MRLALLLAPLAAFFVVACTSVTVVAPAQVPAPAAVAMDTTWAWPERADNLQALPPDTPPERLRETMRGMSVSLGVGCEHCHVGEAGAGFDTWDFASDAKAAKATARGMMEMVWQINEQTLPTVEGLEPADAWRVTCWTCHRGATTPDT